MARSARFRDLERRLRELRAHFLPRQFSRTGSYSPRVIDRTRAYRLLAQAEIESCVEDLARSLASREYQAWEIDREPRTCLMALVSFYDVAEFPSVPESIPATLTKVTPGFLKDRIETAKNAYSFGSRQTTACEKGIY
jgi:hypothetical protein